MFRSIFDFEPPYNPYWPWDYLYPFHPLNTSTTWEKYDNTSDEDCKTKLKDSDDEKPQTYYKEVYEEYLNGEKVKSKEREFVNGKMTKNESYNRQLSESKETETEEKPHLELKKEEEKEAVYTEKPSKDADLRKQMTELEKENKVLRKQQTKLISMLRQIIDEN